MSLLIANITSSTLIELVTLPKRERYLFAGLFISRNFKTRNNWTYYKSYEELAEILDMEITNIRNGIISLQAKGWLSKPETKVVPDPELAGRKIKKYRWRFPKHEAEFAQAKARIKEVEQENEAKRQAAADAVNGNGKSKDRVPELTPEGREAFARVFSNS